MGTASTVVVRDHDGVRRVTLDRPPVNALSMAEYQALGAAFELPDAVRMVLLRTCGQVWSAGQDLDEVESFTSHDLAAHVERAAQCVATVAACPVPVVTVLDGAAVGAGALLVATCDIVLAVPEATLSFPELRRGLRMGRALLSGVLPDPVISYAFATGAPITGAKLESVGLVAEIVPGSEVTAAAEAVIAELMELSAEDLRWLRAGRRPADRARIYLEEVALSVRSLRRSRHGR